MGLLKKNLEKGMMIAFSLLAVIGLSIFIIPQEPVYADNNQSTPNGMAIDFDPDIHSEEDNVIIMKPGGTIKVNPEWDKQYKEQHPQPVADLLETTLEIIQENEEVKLGFSLYNTAKEDLAFYFSSSQKYDIFIKDRNGREVYRWSYDKDFLMAIVDVELKKGQKFSFAEVWDYKDNEGDRVPAGKYTITVKLLAKFKNVKSLNSNNLAEALTVSWDIPVAAAGAVTDGISAGKGSGYLLKGNREGLEFRVVMEKKEFAAEDEIKVRAAVTNATSAPVPYTHSVSGGPGSAVSVGISSEGRDLGFMPKDTEKNQITLPAEEEEMLQPGESILKEITFLPQFHIREKQVPAPEGEYTVQVSFRGIEKKGTVSFPIILHSNAANAIKSVTTYGRRYYAW